MRREVYIKAQTRVFSKVTPNANNVDPRLRLQDAEFVTLASKILKECLKLQDAEFATFVSRDLKRADLKFSKS